GSAAVTWSGRTNAGAIVADGLYRLTLAAVDNAGNRAIRSWTVRVDDTPATLTATAGPTSFSPNGDGTADSTRLGWSASERITGSARVYRGTSLIRSWTVTSAGSGLVRAIWTARPMAAGSWGWTWDGQNAAGALVTRGSYTVRVTAVSSLGVSVLTRPVTVDAFATALSATSLRAGQRLTVTVKTTEPLRAAPVISFTQLGRTAVKRTAVSLGSGRYRVTFTVASGAAGIATIRVAGRDTGGGLNVTTRSVTIR